MQPGVSTAVGSVGSKIQDNRTALTGRVDNELPTLQLQSQVQKVKLTEIFFHYIPIPTLAA
jgi:hypothetical protein